MRWLGSLFVAALLVVPFSAQAAPIRLVGTFSGANENPAVATLGTGFVVVDVDAVAHTLFLNATFSGLTGTTTAAHIHCCQIPPTNAGVATTTPSFVGFPLGVTSGTFTNTLDLTSPSSYNPAFVTANGGTVASAEAALVAGLLGGRAYFNIHTSFVGSGEIRANLAETPEPATIVLVGVGLAAAVVARRRTNRQHAEA